MSSLSGLSASVTRILSLTGFSKELKTKDIQTAFSEWENLNGGFKIKWKDDTSLLIVFQDATAAKRAYLSTIASPPSILTPDGVAAATIKPYDGPDAQSIIQAVAARGHSSNPSRSHTARSNSISVFPSSTSNNGRAGNGMNGNGLHHSNSNNNFRNNITIPEHPNTIGREGSPTLPSLPSHPTLNALITSSLSSDAIGSETSSVHSDPAIVETSLSEGSGAPRIGNPGKRMVGAALGFRHPGLGPRVLNGHGSAPRMGMDQMMRGMGGLVISE